jgi:hypothetical protein
MAKTRRNNRTRKGSKKHRVSKVKGSVKYNMKGCSKKHMHYHGGSGCGSNGCPFGGLPYSAMNSIRGGTCSSCGGNYNNPGPILGLTQTGGSCTTCASCSKTTGGGFYKPAPPLPAPLVGKAWGGEVAKWPGVDGVDSGRNYFANNLYKVDPQTMMKLGGSRKQRVSMKGKRRRNGIKGGGAFQDIINLGRDLSYNFQSTYNSLNGYGPAVNPKPYIQPLNSNKSVI